MDAIEIHGVVWTGREHIPRGRVVVRGAIIQALESLPGGGGGEEREHSMVIAPPLVDAHVHVRKPEDIDTAVRAGVFGLRDMGGRARTGLTLKDRRLVSAGAALCPPNGYGDFLGMRVGNAAEAESRMRELREEGASFVKLIGSGVIDFDSYGGVSRGGFPPKDLKGMVALAGSMGLQCAVHANGDEAVKAALRAGALSIEHGFYVKEETVRLMADEGVFWCPTVYPVARLLSAGGGGGCLERIVKEHLGRVGLAADLGVKLLAGTDAGSPGVKFGGDLYRELTLWLGAGVPRERILEAGTTAGAEVCGFTFPVLEHGAPADMVVLTVSHGRDGEIRPSAVYREGESTIVS